MNLFKIILSISALGLISCSTTNENLNRSIASSDDQQKYYDDKFDWIPGEARVVQDAQYPDRESTVLSTVPLRANVVLVKVDSSKGLRCNGPQMGYSGQVSDTLLISEEFDRYPTVLELAGGSSGWGGLRCSNWSQQSELKVKYWVGVPKFESDDWFYGRGDAASQIGEKLYRPLKAGEPFGSQEKLDMAVLFFKTFVDRNRDVTQLIENKTEQTSASNKPGLISLATVEPNDLLLINSVTGEPTLKPGLFKKSHKVSLIGVPAGETKGKDYLFPNETPYRFLCFNGKDNQVLYRATSANDKVFLSHASGEVKCGFNFPRKKHGNFNAKVNIAFVRLTVKDMLGQLEPVMKLLKNEMTERDARTLMVQNLVSSWRAQNSESLKDYDLRQASGAEEITFLKSQQDGFGVRFPDQIEVPYYPSIHSISLSSAKSEAGKVKIQIFRQRTDYGTFFSGFWINADEFDPAQLIAEIPTNEVFDESNTGYSENLSVSAAQYPKFLNSVESLSKNASVQPTDVLTQLKIFNVTDGYSNNSSKFMDRSSEKKTIAKRVGVPQACFSAVAASSRYNTNRLYQPNDVRAFYDIANGSPTEKGGAYFSVPWIGDKPQFRVSANSSSIRGNESDLICGPFKDLASAEKGDLSGSKLILSVFSNESFLSRLLESYEKDDSEWWGSDWQACTVSGGKNVSISGACLSFERCKLFKKNYGGTYFYLDDQLIDPTAVEKFDYSGNVTRYFQSYIKAGLCY